MKPLISAIGCAVSLLATCAHAQGAPSDAQLGMNVFLLACVPSQGRVDFVEMAARKLQLTEVGGADASQFLRESKGRAWSTGDASGQFALSVTEPRTCSVFVRRVDSEEMRREFDSWLPPASSQYSTKKMADDLSGETRTLSYAISRDGSLIYSWVLRVNVGGTGPAVISVRSAPQP